MSSDLLFPILPREGRVPYVRDSHKVKKVSKEAKLRRLNDEEKELSADAFGENKHSGKVDKGKRGAPDQRHLDIYV